MRMIQKMLSLVVMAAMVLSLTALVSVAAPSEKSEAMDQETVSEVATMDTPDGAQVRWMQLQKSIAKNVMAGEQVVEAVVTDDAEANVSGMNQVISELEVIKEKVSEYRQSLPEDMNASQLAQEFVTVKAEARNRSHDFRQMAQQRLSQDERERIRERVREQVKNETGELEELDEQIQERVREHNADKVEDVLANMGVQNDTLVQKVRSGELNPGEAVSQVAREFRGLGKEKREQSQSRMKEENAEEQVQAQAAVEKANKGIGQRMRNRAEHREADVKEKLEQVRQRIKSKLPDHVKDKLGGSMGPPAEVSGGQGPMDEKDKGPETSEDTNATAGPDEENTTAGEETAPADSSGDNTSDTSGGMEQ